MTQKTQYLDSHAAQHFRAALILAMEQQGLRSADVDRLCFCRVGKTAAIAAGRQRIGVHDTQLYAEKLHLPPPPWGIETCPQCQAVAPHPNDMETVDAQALLPSLAAHLMAIAAILLELETVTTPIGPLAPHIQDLCKCLDVTTGLPKWIWDIAEVLTRKDSTAWLQHGAEAENQEATDIAAPSYEG